MPTQQKELLTVRLAMTDRAKTQSGYALLEIMLAFAVGAIIITGMVSLGVVSVRGLTASRANSEAGKIAQREVDRLKIMRDSLPWSDSTNGFYDKFQNCITSCYISSMNPFTVTLTSKTEIVGAFPITYWTKITTDGSDTIKYEVNTQWSLRGSIKSYKIEGVLTNWRET